MTIPATTIHTASRLAIEWRSLLLAILQKLYKGREVRVGGIVTLKNFCNGKTTSEMYSKKARSQSAATDSELTERSSLLDN